MECLEFLERVVADDIAIEHEEESFFVPLPQDLLSELEGTGRSKGYLFLRVCDFDLVLLL